MEWLAAPTRGSAKLRIGRHFCPRRAVVDLAAGMAAMQPFGTTQPSRRMPEMPEIGHPESYYAKRCHEADYRNDHNAHEACKVGQYVTLALDPALQWEQKLKYFQHALKRHCVPPPYPDDDVWMFYQQLADLVR